MKKLFSILLVLLCVDTAFAGQVGGSGGGTALTNGNELIRNPFLNRRPVSAHEIGKVFEGAKNVSREYLGDEQLFKIDVKNRVVTFDAEREVLDESAVLPFEEVMKYSESSEEVSEDIFSGTLDAE